VGLADRIAAGSSILLDSDALIYFVEEHADFLPVVEPVIEMVASGQISAHASTINLLEVLVRPLREKRTDLAARYRAILTQSRHLTLHPLSSAIAERAAAIRAEFRLTTPDAVVAATALEAGCSFLVTNNGDDFGRIREPEVLVVRQFVGSSKGDQN